MRKLVAFAIAAGMLGTLTAPALAQHRAPASPHRAPARHEPMRPSFHENSISRGHHWRRGQRLSADQRRYVVNDWQRRGLRTPPRGYRWVRENNNSGDFLLVAVATGLIATILSQ